MSATPRGTTTQRAPRAATQQKLDRLLSAAATLIAEQGYQATSMRDLSRATDMGVAGLYHHFKNKEDLATYKAWLAPYQFFRSFVVPPNMAQERSDMLSKAFKGTLEDPELLAMAEKLKLSIQYIPGTEIDQSLGKIFSVTPKVKENLRSLIQ